VYPPQRLLKATFTDLEYAIPIEGRFIGTHVRLPAKIVRQRFCPCA
jgi:hypothetical protein